MILQVCLPHGKVAPIKGCKQRWAKGHPMYPMVAMGHHLRGQMISIHDSVRLYELGYTHVSFGVDGMENMVPLLASANS